MLRFALAFFRVPVAVALALSACPASAETPPIFSFQGVLKAPSGSPVGDGLHTLRFSLHSGPGGLETTIDEPHSFTTAIITLANKPVVPGTEVMKKADGSVTYQRNVHYLIENTSGTIARTSSLSIPNGTLVKVSYQWYPVPLWVETQTVGTTNGLFSALLGSVTPINPASLTGNEWLQVEVQRDGAWEAMTPRQRLASAPYSLRVNSLEGAGGGRIQGPIIVSGFVAAVGPVTGFGGTVSLYGFPATLPGVQGVGLSGADASAPGVVGIAAGGGVALESRGDLLVSGAGRILAAGALRPDYDTGWHVLAAEVQEAVLPLPAALGVGANVDTWLISATEEAVADGGLKRLSAARSFEYRVEYNETSAALRLVRNSGSLGEIRCRVRIWRTPSE
jgi:hypothetical protein